MNSKMAAVAKINDLKDITNKIPSGVSEAWMILVILGGLTIIAGIGFISSVLWHLARK